MALTVAVVGGGIGGFAAAAFLRRAGLHVALFEQAARLTEVGAGLVVAPNAARLLRRLGLGQRLEEAGVRLEVGWEFRRWQDGRVLFAQPLGEECERLYGEATWVLHRADLLGMLCSAVPEYAIHLGKRCVDLRMEDDRATLVFADGSTTDAEVVVAADGVHSILRGRVTAPRAPTATGLCAWRALVPAEAVPGFARRPVQTLWLGHGRHLVHYPVSGGRQVNVVAFTPAGSQDVESWSSQGRPQDLAAEFADWDPRLRELLTAVTSVGRWAVLERDPLDVWTAGRLALLGDAAHPMLPFFAQGAGQAIEDAAVLAACLARDPGHVHAALEQYQQARVPRARRVQIMSRARLAHHHLPDGPEQQSRDAAFAAEDPLGHNGWLYSYDAEHAFAERNAT
ncbi:FAD-dependent monooxygenase [[Actinomadura] parvosata]|uniref:FAD-dependent monooxygenase n=1 Tax=[Actinomadura] parvosata TaxID=1955412 RepID=UPI0016446F76